MSSTKNTPPLQLALEYPQSCEPPSDVHTVLAEETPCGAPLSVDKCVQFAEPSWYADLIGGEQVEDE